MSGGPRGAWKCNTTRCPCVRNEKSDREATLYQSQDTAMLPTCMFECFTYCPTSLFFGQLFFHLPLLLSTLFFNIFFTFRDG